MYWFGLALKLGMSVRQAQQQIDSAEFAEWVAFNNIHPFMVDRVEYAVAIQSALLANIHSKDKKFTYSDFLIQGKKAPKRQSQDIIMKTLEGLYGRHK